MSEKKWKRISDDFEGGEIAGFWTRKKGEVLQGILKGHSNKGHNGFYVVKQDADSSVTVTSKESDKPMKVNGESLVGVSASDAIKRAFEGLKQGTEVRITSNGEKKHPTNKGHSIWDLVVEIADVLPF